jgi:hypothetical protein
MVRPILLASIVAILPSVVQAQGRGMMPAVSHPMTVAPRAAVHAAQPAVAPAMPGARIAARTGALRSRTTTVRITRRSAGTRRHAETDDTAFTSDFIPVPGLGFDMTHLAATRGPEAVGAGKHRRQVPFFFPFFDGGFFLPASPVAVEEAAVPEAQQEAGAEAEVAETPRRARVSQPARTAEIETASAAPRQPEEFVFVRRDGTVFFAIAYAWENGTLRYITSEGLRRSVARETLDLNATQQFNEQRGLNFRLPA